MQAVTANNRWLRFGLKPLVFLSCLIPFGLLLQGVLEADLGANPLERVTDVTGQWGLRFLLLTMAVTPLRRLTGWRCLLPDIALTDVGMARPGTQLGQCPGRYRQAALRDGRLHCLVAVVAAGGDIHARDDAAPGTQLAAAPPRCLCHRGVGGPALHLAGEGRSAGAIDLRGPARFAAAGALATTADRAIPVERSACQRGFSMNWLHCAGAKPAFS